MNELSNKHNSLIKIQISLQQLLQTAAINVRKFKSQNFQNKNLTEFRIDLDIASTDEFIKLRPPIKIKTKLKEDAEDNHAKFTFLLYMINKSKEGCLQESTCLPHCDINVKCWTDAG